LYALFENWSNSSNLNYLVLFLEKEVLNIISNGLLITYFRIFNTLIGILDGPQLLPDFSLEISFSISVGVTG
jgi:hypothetical protein